LFFLGGVLGGAMVISSSFSKKNISIVASFVILGSCYLFLVLKGSQAREGLPLEELSLKEGRRYETLSFVSFMQKREESCGYGIIHDTKEGKTRLYHLQAPPPPSFIIEKGKKKGERPIYYSCSPFP